MLQEYLEHPEYFICMSTEKDSFQLQEYTVKYTRKVIVDAGQRSHLIYDCSIWLTDRDMRKFYYSPQKRDYTSIMNLTFKDPYNRRPLHSFIHFFKSIITHTAQGYEYTVSSDNPDREMVILFEQTIRRITGELPVNMR